MERVFLKTHGRYKKGDVKDWPIGTWATFFPNWRKDTAPVEQVVQQQLRRKEATT